MRCLLAALALLSGLGTVAHAAPPTPYTAEYEVLRAGDPLGHASVTLTATDSATWEYRSVTRGTQGVARTLGVEIIEHSTLRWTDRGPEMIDYHFRQKTGWSRRERRLNVEPEARVIISRERGRQHRLPFQPGVLDRQSVALALAQDLRAGQHEDLTYVVAERDLLRSQRYHLTGEENVRVPAGTMRALRVERVRDGNENRSTTLWFGIEQNYLPVRILQQEPDADPLELRLISSRH